MLVPDLGSCTRAKSQRKRYLPAECTALKLFEYMTTNESNGPFTVYRLMRFERGRWQRRDRIQLMLRQLVELGWVETVLGSPIRYRATEKGKDEYPRVKEYLELSAKFRERWDG